MKLMKSTNTFSKCSRLLLPIILIIAQPVFSEDLLTMDLEDLMNVEVTTASKKKENINSAPSVISVITSEEMRQFGANNLRDVLDRATSVQTFGDNMIPENVVSIRGQATQHENNHVLYLVNGRPFRDSVTLGATSSLLSGFPIDLIDRIEVVRGPGSVLYGTSAFSGVINVITKDAKDLGTASFSTTYGSFDSKYYQGYVAQGGKYWQTIFGAKSLNSNGWDFDYTDQTGHSETFSTDDTDYGGFVNARYSGLTINAFSGQTEQNASQPTGMYPLRTNSIENQMIDLGYEHSLFESWTAKYNVTYNRFDWGELEIGSDDVLGEANISGPIAENVNLLVGGTAERQEAEFEDNGLGQAGANPWTSIYTGYTQADYKPLEWLKLIAGAQYNKPKKSESGVSPRFGAILNANEHWGVKLLHGEAYRSATFVETDINAPGIIRGNPDVSPEEIRTSEIQIFRHAERTQVALTYYHSKMSDLIERVGFPIAFENSGTLEFDGVELEGKAYITKQLSILGNAAYQVNENDQGIEDTTFSPNFMGKLGVAYDAAEGVTLSAYDSYFGEPTQVREFVPTVPEVNLEPQEYHLMTLKAAIDINKVSGRKDIPATTLSLFVDNLLDEDIAFPDINAQQVNSVPIHSGIGFYGTLTFKF